MMMSDDKGGGWVKKGQKHDDVILECPLNKTLNNDCTFYLSIFLQHKLQRDFVSIALKL